MGVKKKKMLNFEVRYEKICAKGYEPASRRRE